MTIITKARPWDAPKSGQVFHFIRGRHFGPSGVRRPFRVLPLLRLPPFPPFLGIGLEAAAAFRWIRLIKCGERESGAVMRVAEYKS